MGFLIPLVVFALADDKSVVAAIVNSEEIRLADVDRTFRTSTKSNTPLTASMLASFRRAAVEDLIDDALVRQFLAKQKIVVDSKEVEDQIKILKESLSKRGETYEQYLKESGYTDSQAREQFSALIGFEKFVAVTGTDAELKKFHSLHSDYFSRVKVRAEIRMIRISKTASTQEREIAKSKLKSGGGEPYLPESKSSNDVWLTQFDSIVEDALAHAAFSINVGETSEPVELEYGFACVKSLERTEPKPVSYEKIMDWVRDTYATQLRKVVIGKMRKESKIQITIP